MNPSALFAAASALTLLVAGCTTPTPYQPYRAESAGGVHGGYSDEQLAADRFRVRFHGNELASRERVEGYMLYRAAELTVQQGYDWFMIVDRHTEHDRQTYVEPDFHDPFFGPGYASWQPHWRYYRSGTGWIDWHPEFSRRFWSNDVDVTTVESFEAEAEIMLRRGAMPTGETRAWDARKVLTDLEPTVVRANL